MPTEGTLHTYEVTETFVVGPYDNSIKTQRDGRLAKQSPYEEKKFMVCASCGAEWEDCKIPVPDESIW